MYRSAIRFTPELVRNLKSTVSSNNAKRNQFNFNRYRDRTQQSAKFEDLQFV